MNDCEHCGFGFDDLESLTRHLTYCRPRPARRAAATLTARRRVPGYPDAERCAGAPTVAVFLATLRRMGVAP